MQRDFGASFLRRALSRPQVPMAFFGLVLISIGAEIPDTIQVCSFVCLFERETPSSFVCLCLFERER
jgi:hypothetical protein